MTKIKFKGYTNVGLHRDVKFFYSKNSDKFVTIENLTLHDLFETPELVPKFKIEEWTKLDKFLGVAKISIKIKL